jgi:hypothetical protein
LDRALSLHSRHGGGALLFSPERPSLLSVRRPASLQQQQQHEQLHGEVPMQRHAPPTHVFLCGECARGHDRS